MSKNNNITIADVEHIAQLSRLEFNESEKESFRKNLNDMVSYFEILSKTDTSQIKDFSKPIGILREDKVKPSLSKEDIIKNAPEKNDNSFIVPRVVE